MKELKQLDLAQDIINAFEKLMANAEMLPYVDPATVFEKYFKAEPPFAKSGDKKHEFPDAFVIGSILDYIKSHPDDRFLIVSDDGDWGKSFSGNTKITITDSLNKALRLLEGNESFMTELFNLSSWGEVLDEIKKQISNKVSFDTWFDLSDYDLLSAIEFTDITITVPDTDYLPLIVSKKEIVFQMEVSLSADGSTRFYDYNNSPWDSEERDYYYKAISSLSFKEASGSLTCEVHIVFDDNNSTSNGKKKQDSSQSSNKTASSTSNIDQTIIPQVEVKLIASNGIQLRVNEERIQTEIIDFEYDLEGSILDAKADMYDTLEDRTKH